jgi:TRAP-type C4-dicarboxylate transport system substrate-binding protein
MSNAKGFSRLLGALGLALALGAAGVAQAAQYTMKMGTATLNDAQHEWMKRFAVEIDKATDGQIKVEIYPASQLGSAQKTIEQVQFNSAQAWVGAAEFLNGVDSRFAVFGAPGVFKNTSHLGEVITDQRFYTEAYKIGEGKGLLGLGMLISGPYTFAAAKPLEKLADFKGMKIRVTASPLQMEQVRALGGAAVPMSLGEVLPALQQGALDGAMANAPVFASMKYYSTVKNQILTDQAMVVAYVAMSRLWFEALPKELQKTVRDVGLKVSAELLEFSKQDIQRGIDEWKANGGAITRLSDAEQKAMFDLLRPVGEQVVSRKENDKKFFDLMVSVAAQH